MHLSPLPPESLEYQIVKLYKVQGGILPPPYREIVQKYRLAGVSLVGIVENRYTSEVTVVFDAVAEHIQQIEEEVRAVIPTQYVLKFASFGDCASGNSPHPSYPSSEHTFPPPSGASAGPSV